MKKIQVGTKRQWRELRKLFADMKTYFGTSRYYEACACELILRMIDEVDAHEQAGYEETRTSCKLNNEWEISFAKALNATVVNQTFSYNYSVHSIVYEDQAEVSPKYTHDLHSITYNRRGLAFIINWSLTEACDFSQCVEIYFRDTKQKKTPAEFRIIIPPPRDYDATRAQEPLQGVSAAAPVPSIPPAEIAVDAGKKITPAVADDASTSIIQSNQGEDSMKQQSLQEQPVQPANEFRYFLKSRRPISGAVPEGYIRAQAGEMTVDFPRVGSNRPVRKTFFGEVVYSEPLTDKQIVDFDLAVFGEFQADEEARVNRLVEKNSATDAAPMKPAVVTQQLENLPQEILAQPRFFAVKKDKAPKTKGWSNPKNQKLYSEIRGLAGFDTAGHAVAADYLFLDFDHVLNDDGEFVNDEARKCFAGVTDKLNTYCELSASGHGIHVIAEPTAGKFKAVSSGDDKGRIYFDAEKKSFLEIFYGTGGRYCLFTGNAFRCEPKTPIAHGEPVDGVFQALLDVIAKRAKKSTPAEKQKTTKAQGMQEIPRSTLPADDKAYDLFRAQIMLDTINPAALSDTDWLAVNSSCKNIGVPYPDVDAFNRRDPERYDEQENLVRWDSVDDPSFDIETLHGIAKRFGYEERDARRQWFELHPELSTKISHRPAPMGGDDGEEKFVWTQDRIKSCPANLRLPADFTFSPTGITQRVKSKKDTEDFKYLPVTKTPIVPTKIFFDPIKGTDEYEIAILSRGKWRRVEVEARILGDARALNMLCDYGALIIENSRLKNFFAAILAINPDLTEIKTYKQTGWTDSNFTTFAYPTGGKDYIVRRDGFNYQEDFKAKGNAELWKQKFKEVSEQGGAVARAFIGTALAAPLARPLNFLNPQAHLNGKSGSGKTALQKFVASIFGNPRKLIRTFAATNKNRLLVAAAYCDLPTFLDELETIQGKAAEEALSNDVYNFADGKGNQANRRDGTARETFEFGSSRLTTGERPILKQHDLRGAYKRLIQLDTTKGLFDDEFAADLHIFSESNFGHFGETWIRYIVANMGEIQKQYHNFAKFKSPKKYEPTQIKSVAAAIVAFEFFSVAIGLKSEFDKLSVLRNMNAIVDTLPDTDELDDTARAIEALASFFAGHEKYFLQNNKDPNTGKEINFTFTNETYGKTFDTGAVAFFPTALKRILEDELHFASAEKLISEWNEQGKLITDKGRTTHTIKINGKTPRVVHFKAGVISTDSDSAEIKYYEELGAI